MTRNNITSCLSALALLVTFACVTNSCAAADPVNKATVKAKSKISITKADKKFRVEIGGKLFTEYHFEGQNKPILYPVLGPHELPMTRNFPMRKVAGEAGDHPHHRSLWFTHGEVNGISFWHEGKGAGTIAQSEVVTVESGDDKAILVTKNKWVGPKGETVCTDTRKVTFFVEEGARGLDYEVTVHASEGDVVFGDTKEGTMGIRTHPNLRLKNGKGVTTANGKAINSEGHRDGNLWGKKAAWVDYWGKIDGKTVGVAIFNHPTNPVHPTWWHARDYGLVAANPFGVHNFEGKKKGTGDMKIAKGESRSFRYRFLFHEGDAASAEIAERYKNYTAK